MAFPRHACPLLFLCAVVLTSSLEPQPAVAAPSEAPQATSFLDNGVIKVGIDANNGGAVSYLSQSGSSTNLVNTFDRGREVQQSYYGGSHLDRRAEGQHPSWSPWPWNPTGAGDAYGNRAIVLASSITSTSMYVKTRPLLWDMPATPCECVFETWIALEGKRVRVHNQLTTSRTDSRWGVASRAQELPAAYPIANLNRVVSYTGPKPFTWRPMSVVPPPTSWIWSQWVATERWGACVDANNFGVGVYSPVRTFFLGGIYGNPSGTTTSVNTCYLAPVEAVALDKTTRLEYDYWLVVGTVAEIRQQAFVLNRRNPAPQPGFPTGDAQIWNFNAGGDFGGWAPNASITSSSVKEGLLSGTVSGPNPYISSFEMEKQAVADTVMVRLRNRTPSPAARLYFTTDVNAPPEADPVWTEQNSKRIPIEPNSGFRIYRVDMSDVPGWTSNITHLRLDPADELPAYWTHGAFAIDWIRIGT